MELARIIISVVLAVMLVITGSGKVLGLGYANGNRDALNVHPVFWRITGGLEVAAAVGLIWGLWYVPFGIAAAIGLVLLMIGAIVFRMRTGKREVKVQAVADVIVLLLAAAVVVLGFLCNQHL